MPYCKPYLPQQLHNMDAPTPTNTPRVSRRTFKGVSAIEKDVVEALLALSLSKHSMKRSRQ